MKGGGGREGVSDRECERERGVSLREERGEEKTTYSNGLGIRSDEQHKENEGKKEEQTSRW